MDLNAARTQHVADDEAHLVVDNQESVREFRYRLLEFHVAHIGARPLDADDVVDAGKAVQQLCRDVDTGPERVVDNDAHAGSFSRGQDVLVEVIAGVREVVWRRYLDQVDTYGFGCLGQLDEFHGAGCLRAHSDADPAGRGLDDGLRDLDPLLQGHRREVAGRSAGEKHPVAPDNPAIDQVLHVPPERGNVDRQVVVAKRSRNWYVAAAESPARVRHAHLTPNCSAGL